MLIFLFLWILLAQATKAFHQTDYEFIHHRMELISYNRVYFRTAKASLVPYNRTLRVFNISFDLLTKLDHPIPISVQVYKFSMNAYRTFPFSLDVDYCKMREENTFGINDLALYSNLSSCPVKKGYYYIGNYRPDDSKFPPHLFPGEFQVIAKVLHASELLAEAHWFGAIKQLEKLWK